MEGVPLRLILSLFLMATVLALAVYEISAFNQFTVRKQFADGIANFVQAMKTLQSTGDYGSFTRVRLTVPESCNFTVDNSSTPGLLRVNFFGENRTFNATGSFLWNVSYPPGSYEIEVYYGNPPYKRDDRNCTGANITCTVPFR
jgi:hypothetical protein